MMSSNLANIYAVLRRKYVEQFMVTYAAPASYLYQIIGPEELQSKVVFIYAEDRNRGTTSLELVSDVKLDALKANRGGGDDLDLTGSPLKDDCLVDAIADLSLNLKMAVLHPWSLNEECHKGIGVDKARAIICTEEFQKGGGTEADQQHGSVWMLCNAADAEKTLLLQYEFNSGHFSRGIVTFMGVVAAQSLNSDTLLRRHFTLMRPGTTAPRLDTTIENTYNIKANVSVRCSWSTAAPLPSLIDLSSCDVVLSQTFRLADCGPLMQSLMDQLRILMYIRDDILAYKEAEASSGGVATEAFYRCGRGIDMEELRENINKVMTEISGFAEIDTGSGTESDIEAVVHRAKQRRLTDLTAKLWEILKCCSSYKDLKVAFNILFQCAARCNVLNTPTNKNRLAEIITELANRRLAIPCLTGSEPMELLLEIGLEKLYKDYEFIFTESQICSANSLKSKSSSDHDKENEKAMPSVRKSLRNAVLPESAPMRKTLLHNNTKRAPNRYETDEAMGFKNSNFDERETALRLAKLLQLHCTLEHILMIHIHLNLSNVYAEVCNQLLQKPLRLLDAIDESFEDKMEIALSAHEVRDHLAGKDPHSRRITLKTQNKFREIKTIFYYSMENICPPGLSESFQAEHKEIVKENVYYSWLYRKIKTVK